MIKFLLALGVGFSPGSVKYIVTLGLSLGEDVEVSGDAAILLRRRRRWTGC